MEINKNINDDSLERVCALLVNTNEFLKENGAYISVEDSNNLIINTGSYGLRKFTITIAIPTYNCN
jgi:hypothetical protein